MCSRRGNIVRPARGLPLWGATKDLELCRKSALSGDVARKMAPFAKGDAQRIEAGVPSFETETQSLAGGRVKKCLTDNLEKLAPTCKAAVIANTAKAQGKP